MDTIMAPTFNNDVGVHKPEAEAFILPLLEGMWYGEAEKDLV
jgi:hypothetical protein